MSSASLETLMERYADGDAGAFDELYGAIRPTVRASLQRWLTAPHLVDDAFQITLLKIHASRDKYRRGAPLLPWVLTIARNVALDRLRARAGRDQALDPTETERIPDPASIESDELSDEDREAIVEAVRDAVAKLPASAREVVWMHKLEGKSMAEVAEILGINEGAVRVRAHRGYKALARSLLGLKGRG